MRLQALALSFVVAASLPASAQVWQPQNLPTMRGVPRMTLPDVGSEEQPLFKTAVVRVGVSVLVVDAQGRPIRDLTQNDFQLWEDGRLQEIATFAPFQYAERSLPVDRLPADPHSDAATLPATNEWTAESRLFAILIDDLHIEPRRTDRTRRLARQLIDRLAPSDLLLVGVTSSGLTTGAFTRDRRRALALIESAAGQRLPDPMIELLRSPGSENTAAGAGGRNTPGLAASAQERIMHLEMAYRSVAQIASAVHNMPARRKTLLFISEGSSVGATVTSMGDLNVGGSANRALQEAMSHASVADMAIYPLNPAGLDTPGERLIEGRMREQDQDGRYRAHEDHSNILNQYLQARQQLRDMAALTGGVSLVDTNDLDGALGRVLSDASDYYVLGYEPDREVKDSKMRSITVKVNVPGARVHARRGYMAPRYLRATQQIKTPSGLTPALQSLLSDVIAEDELPMRMQVVPLVERKGKVLCAVITEVDGPPLVAGSEENQILMEQAVFSLDEKGKATNGTRKRIQITMTPHQVDRLEATALRTIWAVELTPGEHQIRFAATDDLSGRGGSIFVDVDVPKGLKPHGVLVASLALSAMPTAFVDRDVVSLLSGTPTAVRTFVPDDTLQISVAGVLAAAPVRVEDASGATVWEGRVEPAGVMSRFELPLTAVPPGDHRLLVGDMGDGTQPPPLRFSVLPREEGTSTQGLER
jgi:VWFA-related protein